MNEFLGKPKGVEAKKPERIIGREGSKEDVPPETPVFHVPGSKLYHPNAKCTKFAEEKGHPEKGSINRLFKHLPGKEDLNLCPDCDAKKTMGLPKKISLDGQP